MKKLVSPATSDDVSAPFDAGSRDGTRITAPTDADVVALLERLAGSVDAPVDWAAEHDHYVYGTPKRGNGEG